MPLREATLEGGALSVPYSRAQLQGAPMIDPDGAFVWVVSSGRVERRAVTVGSESDGRVEVRAGVRDGDELVSPVVQGLEDGGKVKLKAS